jgi:hypothetical protein
MRRLALVLSLMLVPSALAFAQHDEHEGHGEEVAADAHAEEGGHHGGHLSIGQALGLTELQGAIVNFSLLLLGLVYFGGRKVRASLEERRDRVATELAEAKRLREEAEAKQRALPEAASSRLDDELDAIRTGDDQGGRSRA